MLVNAPGFGAAWETAKKKAHEEMLEEEQGKSLPKRLFRRFFGGGNKGEAADSDHLLEDGGEEADKEKEKKD